MCTTDIINEQLNTLLTITWPVKEKVIYIDMDEYQRCKESLILWWFLSITWPKWKITHIAMESVIYKAPMHDVL